MIDFKDFQKATHCRLQKGESTISYVKRLDKKITEEVWLSLDISQQLWYNNQVMVITRGGYIE